VVQPAGADGAEVGEGEVVPELVVVVPQVVHVPEAEVSLRVLPPAGGAGASQAKEWESEKGHEECKRVQWGVPGTHSSSISSRVAGMSVVWRLHAAYATNKHLAGDGIGGDGGITKK